MAQEERLFGVPDRALSTLQIVVLLDPEGGGSVVVEGRGRVRQGAHTLHVHVGRDDSLGSVIGVVMPLVHLYYLTPKRWAEHAMKVANRLGASGYEVSLR